VRADGKIRLEKKGQALSRAWVQLFQPYSAGKVISRIFQGAVAYRSLGKSPSNQNPSVRDDKHIRKIAGFRSGIEESDGGF
jgi:hypothetical protein